MNRLSNFLPTDFTRQHIRLPLSQSTNIEKNLSMDYSSKMDNICNPSIQGSAASSSSTINCTGNMQFPIRKSIKGLAAIIISDSYKANWISTKNIKKEKLDIKLTKTAVIPDGSKALQSRKRKQAPSNYNNIEEKYENRWKLWTMKISQYNSACFKCLYRKIKFGTYRIFRYWDTWIINFKDRVNFFKWRRSASMLY